MHANLVLFKKNDSQNVISLSSNVTVIGRRHDCDLRVPLPLISRRHCQLSKENDIITIRDLNSSNGTYVNGKRISEKKINAGDYVKIGPLTFMIQINGQPSEIVPPVKSESKPPIKTVTTNKKSSKEPLETEIAQPLDSSDSFPEMDLSDSFMSELENL